MIHNGTACAQCGYPSARLRSYEWGQKAKRRKTTGTGRMRYLKHVARRFKNGFRHASPPFIRSSEFLTPIPVEKTRSRRSVSDRLQRHDPGVGEIERSGRAREERQSSSPDSPIGCLVLSFIMYSQAYHLPYALRSSLETYCVHRMHRLCFTMPIMIFADLTAEMSRRSPFISFRNSAPKLHKNRHYYYDFAYDKLERVMANCLWPMARNPPGPNSGMW